MLFGIQNETNYLIPFPSEREALVRSEYWNMKDLPVSAGCDDCFHQKVRKLGLISPASETQINFIPV
jgi:hypothetical protein